MFDKEKLFDIENELDNFLFNKLNENIPRYKFIYHLNLVYIDFIIGNKLLFTTIEKHFLFSLGYNTFLAFKKLTEEDITDFNIDRELYRYCYDFLIHGMHYSIICDFFPGLIANKINATFNHDLKTINIEDINFPRKNYDFFSKFTMKKALNYSLQTISGRLNHLNEDEASWNLTKFYMNFWGENMQYGDFEPYSREDWAGINLFFIKASMKRFIKMYREDFDIRIESPSKKMIVISPKGISRLVDYTLSQDQEIVSKVLDDFIYTPLGRGLYPKSNISDAPLIKTKDGFFFLNPLTLLFNESCETRLLNNLRKYDNERYLKIKDKLKERTIPLIEFLLNKKFSEIKVVTNFKLPIPGKGKNNRELDILVIDKVSGFVLYIEVKHFYDPISYSERKNLDQQLQTALNKSVEQINAIESNWELIQERYNIECSLEKVEAVILSYQYLGTDVEISDNVPIIDLSTMFESMVHSSTLENLYVLCKDLDHTYKNIKMYSKEINFKYAEYNIRTKLEALDPLFEIVFINEYRKKINENIDIDDDYETFNTLEEYGEVLWKKLNSSYGA